MARDVALDANVLVAWLDGADVLAPRAQALLTRLKSEGAQPVLLDVAITEAVSTLPMGGRIFRYCMMTGLVTM